MGQGSHFTPGFCHETVVFRAAFSDARLAASGAKRDEAAGDGLEHFVNQRGDASRPALGPGGGVGGLGENARALAADGMADGMMVPTGGTDNRLLRMALT